jgi:aminoglycoside 2'-N-acetyltransferase I
VPTVRVFAAADVPVELLAEIRRLLVQAFAGRFSEEDWEHMLGGWHVVVTDGTAAVAHAAVVSRILHVADQPLRAGYVEGVGTTPGRQREGLGSLVMARMSALVRGGFEMGALSTRRHHFYERLGWERWRGPTFVRHGSEAIRTEEEDDGVMALRFGRSQDLDLTASLSCEHRSGDDW